MLFPKVLLIVPDLKWYFGYPDMPPAGVAYLGQYLEDHGVEYDILDMTLRYKFSHLRRKVQQFDPDLIGLSLHTYRYRYAYQLLSEIKKITDKPIVVGGPHVSLVEKRILEESVADFAVVREGELPLLELCLGKSLPEIDNLIYREDGAITENPCRSFIKDLERLSFPRYTKFELEKYARKEIGIVSSRGCPYRCTYCNVWMSMGRVYRAQKPENVVAEMKYWYSKGYRHFNFRDDTFNLNGKRVCEICDLIESEGLKDIFINCSGARLDRIDHPLLERMKEAGFHTFQFGVESVNNKILRAIKKNLTVEQIERGIKMACELDFDIVLAFMIGFPGETLEDQKKKFEFALRYPIMAADFYNVVPFPKTELFSQLRKENLFWIEPEIYLNKVMKRVNMPLFDNGMMTPGERTIALKLGEKAYRKTRQKYVERRLSGWGCLGKVLAWFIFSKTIYQLKLYLDHFRLMYKLRFYLTKIMRLRKEYRITLKN